MPELLTQLPCTAFIQALASRDPVPGGGGASAITGALGAALCSMAGSLSAGRKSLEASREELEQLLVQYQRIQIRLLELVEEDAVAFTPLSRAYSPSPRAPPTGPRLWNRPPWRPASLRWRSCVPAVRPLICSPKCWGGAVRP